MASRWRSAAVFQVGADAARVGTRFVAPPESRAHPDYVRTLLAATAVDTVLTAWFGDGWENAPYRVPASCVAAAQRSAWRQPTPPYRGVDRDASDVAMYSGTGVGDLTVSQPAAHVVTNLVRLL